MISGFLTILKRCEEARFLESSQTIFGCSGKYRGKIGKLTYRVMYGKQTVMKTPDTPV